MTPKADYQLRHGLFGKLGSFWTRQTDATTRQTLRALASASSGATLLTRMDETVNLMANSRRVAVENASFNFLDGDFCYVGRDFMAFLRMDLAAPDGTRYTFSRRDPSVPGQSYDTHPRPHQLSALSVDFVAHASSEGFDPSSDHYLVPVPREITPVTITSRIPDVTLVAGLDFSTHDGYIAMRDNPAEVLDAGSVAMPLAIVRLDQPNSYSLKGHDWRYGNTFIVEYQKNSQSASTLERAAAEAAGMWVLEEDDMVLGMAMVDSVPSYIMAAAGVVEVPYPHDNLVIGSKYPKGHIVGRRFHVYSRDTKPFRELIEDTAGGVNTTVSLDGACTIKGLSWDPVVPVLADYLQVNEDGKPHARLHLLGDPDTLARFWELQRLTELDSGVYLSDALGMSVNNPSLYVYFSDLVETYYGNQLLLLVAQEMQEPMRTRALEFLNEEKPTGCVLLTCMVPDTL